MAMGLELRNLSCYRIEGHVQRRCARLRPESLSEWVTASAPVDEESAPNLDIKRLYAALRMSLVVVDSVAGRPESELGASR